MVDDAKPTSPPAETRGMPDFGSFGPPDVMAMFAEPINTQKQINAISEDALKDKAGRSEKRYLETKKFYEDLGDIPAAKLAELPKPPNATFKDPVQALSSPLILMAGLASFASRRPLTAALGAFGSAVAGFHDGDKDRVALQQKTFEENMERALQQNRTEIEKRSEILENKKWSVDKKMAELTAQAVADEDHVGMKIGKESGIAGIRDLQVQRIEALVRAQQAYDNQALRMMTLGQGLLDDAAIKGGAERMLAGDRIGANQAAGSGPARGINMSRMQSEAYRALQQQGVKDPGAFLAQKTSEYVGMNASQRALGNRAGNIELAVQEAKQTAPILLESSRRVARTNFVPVNKLLNMARSQISDPNLLELHDYLQSFLNIYSRAVVGTGSMTEGQAARSQTMLLDSTGQEGFERQLKAMLREIQVAENAPEQARRSLAGQHEPIDLGDAPAPGGTAHHVAVGPGGGKVYSGDGTNWFTDEGLTKPYEAQ